MEGVIADKFLLWSKILLSASLVLQRTQSISQIIYVYAGWLEYSLFGAHISPIVADTTQLINGGIHWDDLKWYNVIIIVCFVKHNDAPQPAFGDRHNKMNEGPPSRSLHGPATLFSRKSYASYSRGYQGEWMFHIISCLFAQIPTKNQLMLMFLLHTTHRQYLWTLNVKPHKLFRTYLIDLEKFDGAVKMCTPALS